jgi:predicted O-linked N-acetylglucosamine transferase (SPINDLY family)
MIYSTGNIEQSQIPLRMAVDAASPRFHSSAVDLCDVLVLMEKYGEAVKMCGFAWRHSQNVKTLSRLILAKDRSFLWDGFYQARERLSNMTRGYLARTSSEAGAFRRGDEAATNIANFPVMFCTELGLAPGECAGIARVQGRNMVDEIRMHVKQWDTPPGKSRSRLCEGWAAPRRRLRVGYLQATFSASDITVKSIGSSIASHNRSRVEAVCVASFQPGLNHTGDHCERFVRLADGGRTQWKDKLPVLEQERLDVLVDLNGFTGLNSGHLLALEPAPVRVHWHGFPHTMGSLDLVQSYAGDPSSIDVTGSGRLFAEGLSLLRSMPYLVMDYSARPFTGCEGESGYSAASLGLSRARDGHPDGFVFASFNGWFKVHPGLFLAWMEILRAVPNSRLWLLRWSERAAEARFMEKVRQHGVEEWRIVFSDKFPAHHELCVKRLHTGLFLDSPLLNGHTTASDMIYAGIPVLTMRGSSAMTSRIGATFASAGGGAMIVGSIAEYVKRAIQLATDSDERQRVVARIEAHRDKMFSAKRWAAEWEDLLEATFEARREWECKRSGRKRVSVF